MITNIKDAGDHVILNGAKMWISNAPFAQVAVVWARNEEDKIQGVIVERGMEGFTTPTTHGKWSLRASATGELVFDNVKVPKENILPNVTGLKGPLGCLTKARYGIAWGHWVRRWIVMIRLCVTAWSVYSSIVPSAASSYSRKNWQK